MANNGGSSLYRTSCGKHAHYSPDGLGRDGYINYNNGGLLKEHHRTISLANTYEIPQTKRYYSMRYDNCNFLEKMWHLLSIEVMVAEETVMCFSKAVVCKETTNLLVDII